MILGRMTLFFRFFWRDPLFIVLICAEGPFTIEFALSLMILSKVGMDSCRCFSCCCSWLCPRVPLLLPEVLYLDASIGDWRRKLAELLSCEGSNPDCV